MVWIRMMRLMCAAPNDRYIEVDRVVLEQFQLGISTVEDQNCQAINNFVNCMPFNHRKNKGGI
jgi:hypothetical protein